MKPTAPPPAKIEKEFNQANSYLQFDIEEFMHATHAWDLDDIQKRELLSTLWSIVQGFVDLGFGVDFVSLVCGQADNSTEQSTPEDQNGLYSPNTVLIDNCEIPVGNEKSCPAEKRSA